VALDASKFSNPATFCYLMAAYFQRRTYRYGFSQNHCNDSAFVEIPFHNVHAKRRDDSDVPLCGDAKSTFLFLVVALRRLKRSDPATFCLLLDI
jgi:hypothetical protein